MVDWGHIRIGRRAGRGEALGAPLGRLTSFRGGTQQLIDGLASALGNAVETNAEVTAIERAGAHYTICLADGRRREADAVVLATTSSIAARDRAKAHDDGGRKSVSRCQCPSARTGRSSDWPVRSRSSDQH